MKKVYKCFAVSEIFPIFATAILEKTSGNALFDILHDRLTSFDLIKLGKLKWGFLEPYLASIREDVSFSLCRTKLKL